MKWVGFFSFVSFFFFSFGFPVLYIPHQLKLPDNFRDR